MTRVAPAPHGQPRLLALVLLGGTLGTAARAAVTATVPDVHDVPSGTVLVNLVGSFLLGLLLAGLARRGDDTGRRREARLLLGTGFLGGFTTYSAFAVQSEQLLAHSPVTAVVHAAGSVLLGLVAAAAGALVARRSVPEAPA
ncbi:MAG: CrcB family protein [Aeromicrobium erythreum]